MIFYNFFVFLIFTSILLSLIGVLSETAMQDNAAVVPEFLVVSNLSELNENLFRVNFLDQFSIQLAEKSSVSKIMSSSCLNVLIYTQNSSEILYEIAAWHDSKINSRHKYQNVLLVFLSTDIGQYDESYVRNMLLVNTDFFSKIFDLRNSVYLAFQKTSDCFHIWEFYWIKHLLFVKQVAENVTDLYAWLNSISTNNKVFRQDWGRVNITAAVTIDSYSGTSTEEVSVIKNPDETSIQLADGFSAAVFWDFKYALNFTENVCAFEIEGTVFEKAFNSSTSNKSFDIYISHFGINLKRASIAQFLHPTLFSTMSAYFVQPAKHTVQNSYIEPFTMSTWIMIIFTWSIISLLIYIASGCYDTLFNERSDELKEFNKEDALFWVLAAACQKSWQTSPKSFSVKLMLFSTLAFCFFWYGAYTAMILSDLREDSIPIKSFDQLMNYVKVILMSTETGASAILKKSIETVNPERAKKVRIKNATTAWVETVYSQGIKCFVSWPEYFTGVGRRLIGLAIKSQTYGKQISKKYRNVDHLLCQKFSSFPYLPFSMKISMFVHKGSPYTRTLNYRILVGINRGLIRGRYWREYVRRTRLSCIPKGANPDDDDIAITLPDTEILFWILLAGQIVCLLGLLIEKYIFYRNTARYFY